MNDILLRLANADDAVALWRWWNDPETRRNSTSTAELSLQEHMTWFEASLTNPARVIYFLGIPWRKMRLHAIRPY